jgi:hypothetical protein
VVKVASVVISHFQLLVKPEAASFLPCLTATWEVLVTWRLNTIMPRADEDQAVLEKAEANSVRVFIIISAGHAGLGQDWRGLITIFGWLPSIWSQGTKDRSSQLRQTVMRIDSLSAETTALLAELKSRRG